MDNNRYKPRIKTFGRRWLFRKYKTKTRSSLFKKLSSDERGDEYDDEDESFLSPEIDPCILANELRIFVATWNVAGKSPVGSLAVDLDEWLNVKESADIYVLGFQEIVPLKAKNVLGGEDQTEATNWNLLIGQILNDKCACRWISPSLNPVTSDDYNYINDMSNGTSITSVEEESGNNQCGRYTLMASKKMVGVFISVWINTSLFKRYTISSVKVCAVACGIMGYLGNKGSVSVSMLIEGTSFCFIVAHLASGEKKGDEGRRNHQVSEIFKRTTFTRRFQDDCVPRPLTILGHDQIFWFGDLNYRLYLENDLARELIKKHDWTALQEFDQLRKELGDGGVFQGWREGNIEFAPTYKYSKFNCNRYSGTLPSITGEKQRTPAWCDRILWYGKGVKQHSYFRGEIMFSDHRPVSALFSTHLEVVKSNDAKVVPLQLDVPNSVSFRCAEQDVCNGQRSSTLRSLINQDVEASP
ncbi:type I inositol polyphosphate 5-phosphatase 8-like isoform X2 [Rutidosis leptorrhynchoides]|uniref:type I inositol polyphosphate 5-phosphatase 8-like isoform X2 n=1 Tax=Rutidosis leptorrhynchoides TaxID=125765 RepID=UPI003A99616A